MVQIQTMPLFLVKKKWKPYMIIRIIKNGKSIESLTTRLSEVRAGRANPAILNKEKIWA